MIIRRHFALLLLALAAAACSEPAEQQGGSLSVDQLVRKARGGDVLAADTVLGLARVEGSGLDGAALAQAFIKVAEKKGGDERRLFTARERLTGRWVARDLAGAKAALKGLAKKGVGEADTLLGVLSSMEGPEPRYAMQAVKHYRAAADRGDRAGQFLLAASLDSGHGATEDPQRAARWYEAEAKAGLPEAQYNLAELYLAGRGVQESPFRAQRWLQRAVAAGYAPAQHRLGLMLVDGFGVKSDKDAGYALLREAADIGHVPSLLYLGDLSRRETLVWDAFARYQSAAEFGSDLANLRMAQVLQRAALVLPGGERGTKFQTHIARAKELMGVGTYDEAMNKALALIQEMKESDQAQIAEMAAEMERGHRNLAANRRRDGTLGGGSQRDDEQEQFLKFVATFVAIRMAVRALIPESAVGHMGSYPHYHNNYTYDVQIQAMRDYVDYSTWPSF